MQGHRALSVLAAAVLLAATASAQSSVGDIDAHISAAKAAAGLDYRATFVNLCFPGANPALANPAAGRAGGAARGAGPGADARSRHVVRIALQGLRQLVLARHAPALVVGAAHERGPDHPRHELRVGDAAGNHRRPENARARSPADQVRRHQPRARRSRSGRGGTAEAIRRQGGDGRARLGVDAPAAGDRRRRRADARRRRGPRRHEAHRSATRRSTSSRHRDIRQARCRTCFRSKTRDGRSWSRIPAER